MIERWRWMYSGDGCGGINVTLSWSSTKSRKVTEGDVHPPLFGPGMALSSAQFAGQVKTGSESMLKFGLSRSDSTCMIGMCLSWMVMPAMTADINAHLYGQLCITSRVVSMMLVSSSSPKSFGS